MDIKMILKSDFRGRSRKKSTAGAAFAKGKEGLAGKGKFGNKKFLERLLGRKAMLDGNTAQIELLLRAQLGDPDAIQLLAENGFDAKDNLGLTSLAIAALTGDMDAVRILANRGFSVENKHPIFIVPQRV